MTEMVETRHSVVCKASLTPRQQLLDFNTELIYLPNFMHNFFAQINFT